MPHRPGKLGKEWSRDVAGTPEHALVNVLAGEAGGVGIAVDPEISVCVSMSGRGPGER
jgi:hypothetical protein